MKMRLLFGKAIILVIVTAFLSCKDEAPYYGPGIYSPLNGLYSNKTYSQPGSGSLKLIYSGVELSEKEISFEMLTENTASLTLLNIVPGSNELTVGPVDLVRGYGTEGLHFTLTGVQSDCFRFSITGNITDARELSVTLYDISMHNSPIRGMETFYLNHPSTTNVSETTIGDTTYRDRIANKLLEFEWLINKNDTEETLIPNISIPLIGSLEDILLNLAGNVFYLLLSDVTFHPDGYLTAHYAPLADEVEVTSLLFGNASASLRSEPNELTKGFCQYYFRNGYLYVKPDLDNLFLSLFGSLDLASLLEDTDLSINMQSILQILNIYTSVNNWMKDGIRLNYSIPDKDTPYRYAITTELINWRLRPVKTFYYHGNDFMFYLDEKEIKPLIPYLPTLLSSLLEDVEIPNIIESVINLDDIIANTAYTSTFKFGLYVDETQY